MSRPRSRLPVEPFSIHVDDQVLSDLRARIRNTRWPDLAPGATWEQGTDLGYLRQVLAYWADEFDWRAQERKLNELEHFRVELDGVRIHFVHQRARRGRGVPLVLTNGWPSTFVELLPLVPLLTDPTTHGIGMLPVCGTGSCAGWGTSVTGRTAAISALAWPRSWRWTTRRRCWGST